MASVVDLEDEDLIDADDDDLYSGIDRRNDDDADIDQNPEAVADGENDDANANDQPAADTSTRVAPKKRVVKNPQPKLNADRLKGPRGLTILEDWFKDLKFKGKRHEKEDLDAIMIRLEQWTNRLFPKFTFDDCLARIETLGRKKEVSNYVRRIRLDMEQGFGGAVDLNDLNDSDNPPSPVQDTDPFDSLMADEPRTTSTQANAPQTMSLTDEQRERMVRNRLLAEERKLARAKERAEEEARKQREAAEIAEAVAASQALFDDDLFPDSAINEQIPGFQSNQTSSTPNDDDERMEIV